MLWQQEVFSQAFPFEDASMAELFKKITTSEYLIPKFLSKNLRDLLSLILMPNPSHRASFEQIVDSPWMREMTPAEHKSLQAEVVAYAKKGSHFEEKKPVEANFVDLISFFSSKILIRVLERSQVRDLETFTSVLGANQLVAKLKTLLQAYYKPSDLSMSCDGPTVTVCLVAFRQVQERHRFRD